METIKVEWYEVDNAIRAIAAQIGARKFDTIVAVHRGGLVPARMLASALGVKNVVIWDGKSTLGELYGNKLIVDDIVDTGKTALKAKLEFAGPVACIVSKSSEADYVGIEMSMFDPRWIVFPWESDFDVIGERQNAD
jgi:hypoxanthine phosphoribosyltransferase